MPARVAAGLRRHACATLPAECCGALLGSRSATRIHVRTLIPLHNTDASRVSYRIEARSVADVEARARRAGLDVIGFYHSHPRGPAAPSVTDLELACPGYLYVIVEPAGGAVRAWRLTGDRAGFAELPVVLRAAPDVSPRDMHAGST
jgi:proteasome lid subunit RPN8/RPN11